MSLDPQSSSIIATTFSPASHARLVNLNAVCDTRGQRRFVCYHRRMRRSSRRAWSESSPCASSRCRCRSAPFPVRVPMFKNSDIRPIKNSKNLRYLYWKTEKRVYWIYFPKPFLHPSWVRGCWAHTGFRRRLLPTILQAIFSDRFFGVVDLFDFFWILEYSALF
jgi:hypothetical protein